MEFFDILVFLAVVGVVTAVTAVSIGGMPPAARRLIVVGLLVRSLGVVAYHVVELRVYGGGSDSLAYFDRGTTVAGDLLAGRDSSVVVRGSVGTRTIIWLSGAAQLVVGDHYLAVSFLFAACSWAGICLCVLSKQGAATEKGRHLFFVAFFPSLWFWPAAIGKDAVMLLAGGIVAFGVSRGTALYTLASLCVGTGIGLLIRPHVACLMLAAAAIAAAVVRRSRLIAVGVAVLCAGAFVAAVTLLGLDASDLEAIEAFHEERGHATARGGSVLGVGAIPPPLSGILNTLVRPFPWEAHNAAAAFAACEVAIFGAVMFARRRSVGASLRRAREDPWIPYAVALVVGWGIVLGSVIFNVGILVRQRTVLMPLLLGLVAAEACSSPAATGSKGSRLGLSPRRL